MEDTSSDDRVPDPQHESDEHDPELEPYASMSRDEILALMNDPECSPRDLEKLNEFFLDKCSADELARINFSTRLSVWLIEARQAHGNAQCAFVSKLAGRLTRELFDDMPPPGPLHEINRGEDGPARLRHERPPRWRQARPVGGSCPARPRA